MQKILGIAGLLVLLAALAGGVYLSQRSQETRRGAAGGDKSVWFFPEEVPVKQGAEVKTTLNVNFGGLKATTLNGYAKLVTGMFFLKYDSTKLSLKSVSTSKLEGWSVMGKAADLEKELMDSGEAKLFLLALGDEPEVAPLDQAAIVELTFVSKDGLPSKLTVSRMVLGAIKTGGSSTDELVVTGSALGEVNFVGETVISPTGVPRQTACQGYCAPVTPQNPNCGSRGMNSAVGVCDDPMTICCAAGGTSPTAVPSRQLCRLCGKECKWVTVDEVCPADTVSGINCVEESGNCAARPVNGPTLIPTGGPVVKPSLTPVVLPSVTPVVSSCGGRCYGDADCQRGYTCFPLGMDKCDGIDWALIKKFRTGERLSTLELADINRRCPETARSVVSNIMLDPDKMVGVCRKEECVTDSSCMCTKVSPTKPFTCMEDGDCGAGQACVNGACVLQKPTVTLTPGAAWVNLSVEDNENDGPEMVGERFKVRINYNSGGTGKVSGMRLALKVPGRFRLESVEPNKNEFNFVSGSGVSGEINLTALNSTVNLKSSGLAAEAILMPLVPGGGTAVDEMVRLAVYEMVGVDGGGKSVSYKIANELVTLPITVVAKPTPTPMATSTPTPKPDICKFCPSGRRMDGDANCDGKVSMLDFEIWRSGSYDGTLLSQTGMADMDCNGKVNLLDFEVWRRAMYDKLGAN